MTSSSGQVFGTSTHITAIIHSKIGKFLLDSIPV